MPNALLMSLLPGNLNKVICLHIATNIDTSIHICGCKQIYAYISTLLKLWIPTETSSSFLCCLCSFYLRGEYDDIIKGCFLSVADFLTKKNENIFIFEAANEWPAPFENIGLCTFKHSSGSTSCCKPDSTFRIPLAFTYHLARRADMIKRQNHGMIMNLAVRQCFFMKATGWRVTALVIWKKEN